MATPVLCDAVVDEGPTCPVCLTGLSRAMTFDLPCGHCFHALCISSALQVSQLCPMCRAPVEDRVCHDVAMFMAAPGQRGNQLLAAELLMELRERGRTVDSEQTEEETLNALRRATRQGDASKIPHMAALLGRSSNEGGAAAAQAPQSLYVRLAAVEALQELVPALESSWVGLPHVLDLLRSVCSLDGEDLEVRCAALRTLQKVSRRGDEATLLLVGRLLQDCDAVIDLRLQAADALQALAVRGDVSSMRAALAAMTDPDTSLRDAGLSFLRTMCSPRGSCTGFLDDLALVVSRQGDVEVRCAALELIAHTEAEGGAKGIAAAAAGLQDSEEQVALTALATLRRLWRKGDPEAVGILIGLARLPDMSVNGVVAPAMVRAAALEALVNFATRGDAHACAASALALGDTDPAVRAAATQALRQLCSRGDIEVVGILLGYLGHSPSNQQAGGRAGHDDIEVRCLAVEMLGRVAMASDQDAKAVLNELAWGEDMDLQLAAQQALKQIC